MAYENWLYGDPAKVLERLERQSQNSTLSDDQSEAVDSLLELWYRWAMSQREYLGLPRVSPMFRDAESSEVHDTVADRDMRLRNITAGMVDACLSGISAMERVAIDVYMRNRVATFAVHRNPRFGTPEQQARAYVQAKEKLFPIMKRKGLVQ